jgi:hypothetical protein
MMNVSGEEHMMPWMNFLDINKVNGQWLSTEDKQLYNLQMECKGEVGYSTRKVASMETIHPSKWRKLSAASPSTSTSNNIASSETDNSANSEDSAYEETEDKEETTHRPTRKHSKSKYATKLVTSAGVSKNKAAKICKQLSSDGIDIPTRSQAAI